MTAMLKMLDASVTPKRPAPKIVLQDIIGSAEWFDGMVAIAAQTPGDLTSVKVTVNPAFAKWLLDNRNNCPPDYTNRAFSEAHAENWARRIKAGAYRYSSQGISICREGFINNGQHRLGGIFMSGVSLPIYMTFGEDREAFAILDVTRVRSRRDALGQMNKANVNTLSAGAGLINNIENDTIVGNTPLMNEDLESFLDVHPMIDKTVEMALPLKRMGMSAAGAVAAIYLIQTKTRHPAARISTFVDEIVAGGATNPKSAIKVFRERMMTKKLDDHVRSGGYKAPAQAAAMILAWNLYVKNKGNNCEPHKLRWAPMQEVENGDKIAVPFPKPE